MLRDENSLFNQLSRFPIQSSFPDISITRDNSIAAIFLECRLSHDMPLTFSRAEARLRCYENGWMSPRQNEDRDMALDFPTKLHEKYPFPSGVLWRS